MKEHSVARWKRFIVATDASEIAEAALVLPILFTLLLGILSFARAYNIYTTITYAAHEGARTAVESSCATCGNQPARTAQVAATVSQVLQASKIDPTKIQIYTGTSALNSCAGGPASCSASGQVTVCTNVAMNATTRRRRRGGGGGTVVTGPAACGATVTFQYPFQFDIPFVSVNRQTVTLKADVEMEGEE